MPVTLQSNDFPLPLEAVQRLWAATVAERAYADEPVVVRTVSAAEIQQLNAQYRGQRRATNVLTFSYTAENFPGSDVPTHDVALCLTVATQEARTRTMALPDYTALLLVHAFLHVTGLDHEHSVADKVASSQAEKNIMRRCGFSAAAL